MANPYPFTLRLEKGSALTHQELDDNFRYLDYGIENVTGGTSSGTTLTGLPYSVVYIDSGGTPSTSNLFKYVGETLKIYGGDSMDAATITGLTADHNRHIFEVGYAENDRVFINTIGNNNVPFLDNQFSGITLAHINASDSAAVFFHVGDYLTRDAKQLLSAYTSGDTNEHISSQVIRHDEIAILLRNTIANNERRILLDGTDAIQIRARQISTGNGSQILVANGGVSISETNSPVQYLLTVNGTSRLVGDIFAGNKIYLGSTSTGNTMTISWDGLGHNTLMAYNSFENVSSALNTVVIGGDSLQSNVGIQNSVSLGHNIAQSATTVDFSVMIGNGIAISGTNVTRSVLIGESVAQNHGGYDDVIIGYHTGIGVNGNTHENVIIGSSAVTADNAELIENVIIGVSAAIHLSSATSNVIIGPDALYNSTTGGDNVIIGDDACLLTTAVGYGNFVAGEQSAQYLASNYNVLLGYRVATINDLNAVTATEGLTSGSYNTFVGANSGRGVVSGQENIAIGASTQFASGNISNSIAFGNGARVTSGNQFVLGSSGFTFIDSMYLGGGIEQTTPESDLVIYTTKATAGGGGSGTNLVFSPGVGNGIGTDGFVSFEAGGWLGSHTPVEVHRIDGIGDSFYGGITINRDTVSDANYTIAADSRTYYIAYTALTSGRTVTLPLAASVSEGRTFVVKDAVGLSGTYNITIIPSGGDTVDLVSNYVMSVNKQAITVVSDGVSNWEII